MPTVDPAAPADAPDIVESLTQAHDFRTLGAALVKKLRIEGQRITAEGVRLWVARDDNERDEAVRAVLGATGGIISSGPPKPADPADAPDVEALAQAHDSRTLGAALYERAPRDGERMTREAVRHMLMRSEPQIVEEFGRIFRASRLGRARTEGK